MLIERTFDYCWRLWVSLFEGWGLPWSSQASAYLGLIVVFYLVGLGYKKLTARED
jgi:hypothetical protein